MRGALTPEGGFLELCFPASPFTKFLIHKTAFAHAAAL